MLDISTGEEDIFYLLAEEAQAEDKHDVRSMPSTKWTLRPGPCGTLFIPAWKIHDANASVSGRHIVKRDYSLLSKISGIHQLHSKDDTEVLKVD